MTGAARRRIFRGLGASVFEEGKDLQAGVVTGGQLLMTPRQGVNAFISGEFRVTDITDAYGPREVCGHVLEVRRKMQ